MTRKDTQPEKKASLAVTTSASSAGAFHLCSASPGLSLRPQVEANCSEKTAKLVKNPGMLSSEETRRMLSDLQIHQVELEIQNEELRRIQAELDSTTAGFFDFYDLAPVGYVTLSENGLILKANQTTAILLGIPQSGLVNQSMSQFIHKEDQDIHHLHHRQLLMTGDPQVCDLRMVGKGASELWVRLNSICAHDLDGTVVYRVVLSDIAGQKQAEMKLRQSEERFRKALLNVPCVAVQGYAPDGTTRYWNHASEQLYGYSAQEAIGRNLVDLIIPPEMRGEVEGAIRQMAETKQPIPASELLLMRKDGSRVAVFSSHTIVQVPGSEPELFCVDIDITKRKLYEKALCQQSDFLKVLLETIPNPIYYKDVDGKYTGCNKAFEEYLGVGRREFLGKTVQEIVPQELADTYCQQDQMLLKQGGKQQYEGLIQDKTKSNIRHVIFDKAALLDKEGKIDGLIGVISDITERKRAEEERDKLQSQINQIQKMESVGRLAGGVAHDFNNMLGVIIGYTQMAIDETAPESSLHQDLLQVLEAAQRSANITRQLLAFARKQPIAPKILNLNETIEQGMLQMLRRLIGENIALAWKPKANLWKVKIDASQLDQLLVNLCANARDSITGAGKLIIRTGKVTLDELFCTHHLGAKPGEYVLLSVADNGCGMNQEVLDNIFEPFFTTKELGQGTGLGLATVYGIVKQNNGFIDVVSAPSQGTTFSLYLPRYRDHADQSQQELSLDSAVGRGYETILLVEDEVMILEMATNMLQSQGYTVLATAMPGEAIKLARQHPGEIHLLITDVIMPEMNGVELADRLHSLYPDMKRLFMSGYTADVIAVHGVLDDERLDYIQKPFLSHVLLAKVAKILSGTPLKP